MSMQCSAVVQWQCNQCCGTRVGHTCNAKVPGSTPPAMLWYQGRPPLQRYGTKVKPTCNAMVLGLNTFPSCADTATQVWLLPRSFPACTTMTWDWSAFMMYPTGVSEYWNVLLFLLEHTEASVTTCGQQQQ
jgi:hypothetical protein